MLKPTLMLKDKSGNIKSYILKFPKDTQKLLEQLKLTIRKAAPDAEEVISYNMPAFKYYGMLLYFAAYNNHIGLYPMASGIRAFKKELLIYKCSIGTVQLPLDRPLPMRLITKIVKYRVKENFDKEAIKKSLKKDKRSAKK